VFGIFPTPIFTASPDRADSPVYAPALNPVEQVWSWLKYGRLANFVPDGVQELDDEIVDRLIELKCDPGLLRGLWTGSDLPFPGHPIGQPCLPAGQ
jgi:putative transposase